MAAELILEFEGVTLAEYHAVNKELGIDPGTGEGNWPDGLVAQSAGLNENGHLVVHEVLGTPSARPDAWKAALGKHWPRVALLVRRRALLDRAGDSPPPRRLIDLGALRRRDVAAQRKHPISLATE